MIHFLKYILFLNYIKFDGLISEMGGESSEVLSKNSTELLHEVETDFNGMKNENDPKKKKIYTERMQNDFYNYDRRVKYDRSNLGICINLIPKLLFLILKLIIELFFKKLIERLISTFIGSVILLIIILIIVNSQYGSCATKVEESLKWIISFWFCSLAGHCINIIAKYLTNESNRIGIIIGQTLLHVAILIIGVNTLTLYNCCNNCCGECCQKCCSSCCNNCCKEKNLNNNDNVQRSLV